MLVFVRSKNERILAVMNYMQKNLKNKLDAKSLVLQFGFSDRVLSRLFYIEGIGFVEYLQAIRIIKSMELLSGKNMNVNMVPSYAGYESVTALAIFLCVLQGYASKIISINIMWKKRLQTEQPHGVLKLQYVS